MKNNSVRVGRGVGAPANRSTACERQLPRDPGRPDGARTGVCRGRGSAWCGGPGGDVRFGFWQGHLRGDPGVAGTTLTINDVLFTVVGVVSAAFGRAEPVYDKALFLPMAALTLLRPGIRGRRRFSTRPSLLRRCFGHSLQARVHHSSRRTDALSSRFQSFSGNAARGVVVTGTEFLSQPAVAIRHRRC